MQKIFIVDASGYLFSSYFAIRNMTNSDGESTNALFGFIRSMLKLIKDFQPTHLVAVFDGPNNAKKRIEIFPEYKAHRSEVPKDLPYQIARAQEFCTLFGIPLLNLEGVEADDVMGSVAQWATKQSAISYICTSDKDMCQMVNEHIFLLNTRKDNLIIGPPEVEEQHGVPPSQIIDLLAMIGDASDNIPGIPGIGPKTASTLLKEFGSLDALLAHPEKLSGKKKDLIIENKDKAILSRDLVTLDLNVPIPNDGEFYLIKPHQFPDLKKFYSTMSFNSLIKELEITQQDQHILAPVEANADYKLINSKSDLDSLINILSAQKEICIHVETTEARPLEMELVGIGFSFSEERAWYIPLNGQIDSKEILLALKPLFENPAIAFFGHDVKPIYHALKNAEITLSNISFDTHLASFILNSHHRQHTLDDVFLQHFNKTRRPIKELIGSGKNVISISQIPIEQLSHHCCEEVSFIWRLKQTLTTQLAQSLDLTRIMFDIELPLLKILANMERRGIFVDTQTLGSLSTYIQSHIQNLQQTIYFLAGEEFNLNSPKQLGTILQEKLHIPLKKTATGFSTSADILENLTEEYPITQNILDYRALEKLRSTYVESLPNDINPHTHRIHCTFNQTVAATGRLSCQDPNLQNIPVRTEEGRKIREAFRPQNPEWTYLSADYSQIELRLVAHFSEDPTLIAAFNNNEDIHTFTAAIVLGIPPDQVTKELRYQAKAVNFGIIYGQQAFGLAKELHINVKAAADFIDRYFERYPHVKQYLEMSKAKARITGKAVSLMGRERLIPEINSPNGQLRALAERLAVNTPLQGTAADLIKLAMLKVNEKLSEQELNGYMILQVHDELIFELPKNEIEIFTTIVKDAMQNVVQLKVPLIVNISLGKNWKEC